MAMMSCSENFDIKNVKVTGYDTKSVYNSKVYPYGPNNIFCRIIGNGDSLFYSFFLDSNGSKKDAIFYTTGNTKMLQWEEREGKQNVNHINIQ